MRLRWPCPHCGREFLSNADDPPPSHNCVRVDLDRTELCKVCAWADPQKQYQCRLWPRDAPNTTGMQRAVWHWLRGRGGLRCPGYSERPIDK